LPAIPSTAEKAKGIPKLNSLRIAEAPERARIDADVALRLAR